VGFGPVLFGDFWVCIAVIDPIYQSDRPFRKADFRFSTKRLLVAMIAIALIMTVTGAMDQSFDVVFIPLAVVLFILFNDWSSWWFHRGQRALRAGMIPQAIADFTRAIDASPEDPLRYYCRAAAQLQIGEHAAAREDVDRSEALAPESALPVALRGWINFDEGRNDDARTDFLRAIELDPMAANAEMGCAYVDFVDGKGAEAIRRLEQCRKLHPRDAQAKCLLAWFLSTCREAQLRDGERAIALAEPASRMMPQRFLWGELALAGAYGEVGRFAEAIEHAEHAVRLANPNQLNDALRHVATLTSGNAIRTGLASGARNEEDEHEF
jgi:tetratricopeptide (TPR) repeat protein